MQRYRYISETGVLGILTRSLTPAYNVMKEDLTNDSQVSQGWRRNQPMRVEDSDISIMYWLTNWVTVGHNEIQTAPQQKCIPMEKYFHSRKYYYSTHSPLCCLSDSGSDVFSSSKL